MRRRANSGAALAAGSLLLLAAAPPTVLPANARAAATAAMTAAPKPPPGNVRHYLLPSQVDIVELLPPPPDPDSAEQRADLTTVLEAQQAARASGATEHAVADVELSCGRFADVLGDELNLKANVAVMTFLNEAAHEAAAVTGPAKQHWRRTRPYAYSGEVERLGDVSPDWQGSERINTGARGPAERDKAADELAHSSYPSGHATFATVCAILLSEIVPEKRAALFERSHDYEHSRMVLGAHFPSDLRAGEIAGTVAAQMLMQNVGFEHDLAAARAALRAALGLPPAPPAAAPEGDVDE